MKREKQESTLEKATTKVEALKTVETLAETKGKVAIEVMQEQGITLVALVITIVIIIILATVTINMAFGDNGLIKQAELARDLASNSTTYEEESMANLTAYMNKMMGEEVSTAKTLVQAFKDGEIEAGDYVNYKPSEVKSVTVGTDKTGYTNSKGMSDGTDQTFTTDMNTTWQVLGLSEDGQHLLLTSGSPIKKDGDDPYLILQGTEGYLYCADTPDGENGTLDEIAEIYHNSELAEETRSMTIEDIENVLEGVTVTYPTEGNPNTGTVYFNADANRTNIGGQISPYASYTYTLNDYSPESAVQSPPQQATVGTRVNGSSYGFVYNYETFQVLGININQETYDMLFDGTTDAENLTKAYWLASPGVYAYSNNYAYFGPGLVYNGFTISCGLDLFKSDGNWRAFGFAVRPVVVLKSNINVNQLQVIEDQTEEAWSTKGGQAYGSGSIGA